MQSTDTPHCWEGAAGQAQATYRFIHDRIYEAAYALIPERDRAADFACESDDFCVHQSMGQKIGR